MTVRASSEHGLLLAALRVACALVLLCAIVVPARVAWAEEDVPTGSSSSSSAAQESSQSSAGGEAASEGESATPQQPDDPSNVVNPRQTPDNSFLYDTSIDELVQADSSYQGNYVQIVGEVVGDSLAAEEDPGHHWITLESLEHGSSSSISVLIDDKYLGFIDAYGRYNQVGTKLQVRGTFYLTCPSHEGIMDIHAESVRLVEPGVKLQEEFDFAQLAPGIVLVLFGIALTVLYNHLHEKER